MKRKYAAILMTSIMAAAVLFAGCGDPGGSAEEPVNVEGESIAGSMQSVASGEAGGQGTAASGSQEPGGQKGGSGSQEPGSQEGDSGSQEPGSQEGGSGGQQPSNRDIGSGGRQAGSQGDGAAPANSSHPDLLSRKTHTSLFTDMAIQGSVVELTEGGCVIDPPQVLEGSSGTIMVGGSGGQDNYVTAAFDSDCRVYRSTYNEADGSVSLEECAVSDIAVDSHVLLYGTLSGKSIAVSDVVISG